MGHRHSPEARQKISRAMKGKKYFLGHKHSPEAIQKISQAMKSKRHALGFKHTPEAKAKIAQAKRGERNHNWKGGITFQPYSVDWTATLRRSIRERDHYRCRMCGEPQGEKALAVHHLDANKQNCNPDNLATLCGRCHRKAHGGGILR